MTRRFVMMVFAVLLLLGSAGPALADDGSSMRGDGNRDDWAQAR